MKASLLRNLDILNKLGCLDDAGMGKLRTGNAPTVTKGPYPQGQVLHRNIFLISFSFFHPHPVV